MTRQEVISRNIAIGIEIDALKARRVQFAQAAPAWEAQATQPCTGYVFQRDRDACQLDRDEKRAKAASYYAEIRLIDNKIKILESEYATNLRTLDSLNVVDQDLAKQGTTADAIHIKAVSEAEKLQTLTQAEVTKTTAEEDRKSNINTVVLAIVILLVLIFLFALIRRIKNKKKAKK